MGWGLDWLEKEKKENMKNKPPDLLDHILKMNGDFADSYASQTSTRARYAEINPTRILVTECMDGRVNFSRITGLPLGFCTSLRNIGGKYEVGWPLFDATIREWDTLVYNQRQPRLFISTYHFASREKRRGCAGFNYNTEAARESAQKLQADFYNVYQDRSIHSLVVGIDTDTDGLMFHG